jgi:hypothetical protein
MPIKSGTVGDMLKTRPEQNFFLSKAVIAKEPSTKPRDKFKRRRVIAIEMAMVEKNFDASKFPLANLKRRV